MDNVRVTISDKDMAEIMQEVIRQAMPQILDELERYSKAELQMAYGDADYNKHRTQNLKDSYVYGIFYKGVLQRYGFLTESATAREVIKETGTGRLVYGRDEATDFIKSYKPNISKQDDFNIVFAAKMYYGAYLENGTARNQPYTVISSIYHDVSYDPMIRNLQITTEVHTY